MSTSSADPAAARAEQGTESLNDYTITVSDIGYSPKVLHLPDDKQVTLAWATKGGTCCAMSVVIPALDYQKIFPANSTTLQAIPPQKEGTVIDYTCSMGRRTGKLIFDLHSEEP